MNKIALQTNVAYIICQRYGTFLEKLNVRKLNLQIFENTLQNWMNETV